MKLNMAPIARKLVWLVFITFLLPPVFVITIDYTSLIFPPEFFGRLLTHWSLFVLTAPFIIGGTLIIRHMVKKIEKALVKKKHGEVLSLYKRSTRIYLALIVCYSASAFVISELVGCTNEERFYGFLNALLYLFLANAPFLLLFYQFMDDLIQEVPKDTQKFFTVKNKFRLITLFSSVCGVGLVCLNGQVLLWRITEYPEMGITPENFVFRLGVVGLIVVVLQVAPNFLLGKAFSERLRKLKEVLGLISRKTLSKGVSVASRDEFGHMADAIEEMRLNLKGIIQEIGENSDYLNRAGSELTRMSESLSSNSAVQASGAEEIASSIEEMAANINVSTDNSMRSSDICKEAQEHLVVSDKTVHETLASVQSITEKVDQIEEIAKQTNLLAINAYVEAANAGSYGASFSVIAREVRELADRTAVSSNVISELAEQCLSNSRLSKERLGTALPVMEQMATLSSEVALSSQETRSGSEQIHSAVHSFNQVSQSIAASAEELTSSAQELQSRSSALDALVKEFKL